MPNNASRFFFRVPCAFTAVIAQNPFLHVVVAAHFSVSLSLLLPRFRRRLTAAVAPEPAFYHTALVLRTSFVPISVLHLPRASCGVATVTAPEPALRISFIVDDLRTLSLSLLVLLPGDTSSHGGGAGLNMRAENRLQALEQLMMVMQSDVCWQARRQCKQGNEPQSLQAKRSWMTRSCSGSRRASHVRKLETVQVHVPWQHWSFRHESQAEHCFKSEVLAKAAIEKAVLPPRDQQMYYVLALAAVPKCKRLLEHDIDTRVWRSDRARWTEDVNFEVSDVTRVSSEVSSVEDTVGTTRDDPEAHIPVAVAWRS